MGYDVTIFTSNSSHATDALPQFSGRFKEEIIDGIRTFWLNIMSPTSSSGMSRVISWFMFEWTIFRLPKGQMKKPDVVIVSSLSILSVWSGLFYSWKYKTKFIFEVRDIWPLSGIKLGGISKWNPLMVFLAITEKLGYKYSDSIIGTMPNLVSHVNNVSPNNIKKVVCIPQCYDEQFYKSEQSRLEQDFVDKYIRTEIFTICYAGTISNNNPLNQLFDSVKGLNCRVLVVGSGKEKLSLEVEYED